MDGVFDPDAFLTTTTTDAMDTRFDPIAVGEYPGIPEKLEVRQFNGTKDPSKTYTSLDITWDVDAPGEKARLGRDKLSVRQSLFLDMSAAGGLDTGKGKNIGLGRLREALNLNTPGVPFSFNDLIGRGPARISVTHRSGAGDEIFAEVKGVARLA